MAILLTRNSCRFFNSIRGADKEVNVMLQGIELNRNKFRSGGPFSMYRNCLLLRHHEGHLHAQLLLLYQEPAALCMRWLDKISRMNYYSKGIWKFHGSWKLGTCQLLLFNSAAYHLHRQGQINTVWLHSCLQIIFLHIYVLKTT